MCWSVVLNVDPVGLPTCSSSSSRLCKCRNTGQEPWAPGPSVRKHQGPLTTLLMSRSASRSQSRSRPAKSEETPLLDKEPRVTVEIPSDNSPTSPSISSVSPQEVEEKKSKWVQAGEKVNAYNRLRRPSMFVPRGPPGQTPGLDMSHAQSRSKDLNALCRINVVDYSADKIEKMQGLTNNEFIDLLKDGASTRPEWSKVRWISISGMSWDVIHAIATRYSLHPLAVEDACHLPQRVKADYFSSSLYVSALNVRHRTTAPAQLFRQPMERTASGGYVQTGNPVTMQLKPTHRSLVSEKRADQKLLTPKARKRITGMMVGQVAFFLTQDSTLISLFEEDGSDVEKPLIYRLFEPEGTFLRESEDASFLLYSMLDTLVDQFLDVVDRYSEDLEDVQVSTLHRPVASNTRELFLIQGELVALHRMMAPFRGLVTSLQTDRTDGERWDPITRHTGFYLGDVNDHIMTCLETIESLERQCQELTDYIFNVATHETNETLRSLTTVSLLFLPLSFLTGLYGTNWTVHYPPLDWKYGWFWFVGTCILVSILTTGLMVYRGVIRPYDKA